MITPDEKCSEYLKLLRDVTGYMRYCAERRMAPLLHDVAVYESRLEQIRSKRVAR